jgi:hypothetical protein
LPLILLSMPIRPGLGTSLWETASVSRSVFMTVDRIAISLNV